MGRTPGRACRLEAPQARRDRLARRRASSPEHSPPADTCIFTQLGHGELQFTAGASADTRVVAISGSKALRAKAPSPLDITLCVMSYHAKSDTRARSYDLFPRAVGTRALRRRRGPRATAGCGRRTDREQCTRAGDIEVKVATATPPPRGFARAAWWSAWDTRCAFVVRRRRRSSLRRPTRARRPRVGDEVVTPGQVARDGR
jgi:hypothetical protein